MTESGRPGVVAGGPLFRLAVPGESGGPELCHPGLPGHEPRCYIGGMPATSLWISGKGRPDQRDGSPPIVARLC